MAYFVAIWVLVSSSQTIIIVKQCLLCFVFLNIAWKTVFTYFINNFRQQLTLSHSKNCWCIQAWEYKLLIVHSRNCKWNRKCYNLCSRMTQRNSDCHQFHIFFFFFFLLLLILLPFSLVLFFFHFFFLSFFSLLCFLHSFFHNTPFFTSLSLYLLFLFL